MPRVALLLFAITLTAAAQISRGSASGIAPGNVDSFLNPMNFGNFSGGVDASFQSFDFVALQQETYSRDQKKVEEAQKKRAELVSNGIVSALDLQAPTAALAEYSRALSSLKQNPKGAVTHLQKALAVYPKFVTAHMALGNAFFDTGNTSAARTEFETAAKLDDKFAAAFIKLGRLDLNAKDYPAAQQNLQHAADLRPRDPQVLVALAYAQHGAHQYHHVIETSGRVHAMDHTGLANVHYVAAVSAIALTDYGTAESEYKLFLNEDAANPLAPAARHNVEAIQKFRSSAAGAHPAAAISGPREAPAVVRSEAASNAERLRAELAALGPENDEECADCAVTPHGPVSTRNNAVPATPGRDSYAISRNVDEVALYFTATKAGAFVSDLAAENVTLQDDNKPPAKIMEFMPQAKLPMRLGLVIDTSDSIEQRFAFEKQAATRFIQGMLTNPEDLAFVMGFSARHEVTQDFTVDRDALASGVDKLRTGGGTALFDAISFAAYKLGLYPDENRVARVLVLVTDGEDNSSLVSLRQAIQHANNAGVIIYVISTRPEVVVTARVYPGRTMEKRPSAAGLEAQRVLQALADRTGGELMFAGSGSSGDISQLGRKFDSLHDIIRNRYLIAYRPANFETNGRFRKVNITATKNGQKLAVKARKGYWAHPTDSKTP